VFYLHLFLGVLAPWRELAAMRQFELRVRVVSEHILLDFQIPNSTFRPRRLAPPKKYGLFDAGGLV
jgi:hypothetical protein